MGPIGRYCRLSAADRTLLIKAGLWLGATRVALWLFPLRIVRHQLARAARPRRQQSLVPSKERLAWAVRAVRRLVPGATCLSQALATEALLAQGGHPAELRFGVVKTDAGRLSAHAWVESEGHVVIGGLRQLSSYTPFPPLPTGQAMSTGTAFGFQVRCGAPLRFLRSGGGGESLEVVVASEPARRPATAPCADWPIAGLGGKVRGTLYQVNGSFEFWTTDIGGYRIDPEAGRIEIPACSDHLAREQRLWNTPAALCFMHRGDVPVHAAAVEIDAGAVLLAAPHRHGKTTLALAFHRHGYRVLSEDLACCRLDPDPTLLPSPAVLRLRPDVYQGRPPTGTHLVAARPGRVYIAVDEDRRGSGAPVPIVAIVFLRESAHGITIERTPAARAIRDLWALGFHLPIPAARARSFTQLTRLAGAIPTWNLYRPARLDTLDATVSRVVAACRRLTNPLAGRTLALGGLSTDKEAQ